MPTYGSVAGVQARLGARGAQVTATSRPSTTDVGLWLDEAEAELLGAIQQGGGPGQYAADSRGARTIRGWVENRIAGLLRIAHAAAGGEGSNDDGQWAERNWQELLVKLRANAGNIIAGLNEAGVEPTASIGPKGHTNDPILDLAEEDYEPFFRRSDVIFRRVF